MARNQHKKDLINLAEAYGSVLNEGHDEREQLDEIAPLVAAGIGGLAGGVIADDEEADTREVEHIDLSQWWKYEPHEVIQQVMWRNRVVKGSDHDEAKIWANIEPKLNSKWPRPAEDGEFNLRDVNPKDTLFGDRKREESEEDQEIGEDAAGSPNVVRDLLEKVYEISGRLHGEVKDLGIFLPQEHSKRWTKLEELQKELESVVDEYGDDKFWADRQEDRKYSAEPTGYHEW
tara:strand:- start:123 stop:818 length:696 start_codon:yes stop_codon:yes gene_type:complete